MGRAKHPLRRLFLLLLLGLLAWGFIGDTMIDLQTITISSPRLPQGFDGFRIVQLSDLHAREFGTDNERLVALVAAQRPDLIALTGDFAQEPKDFPVIESLFVKLAALAPTYYVAGNHEWGGRIMGAFVPLVESTGAVYLSNETITLTRGGDTVRLVGIEDLGGRRDMKPMPEVVRDARQGGDPFLLMLCHRYDRFDEFVALKIDLALTGHAHGGLIRLPFTDGLLGPGRVWFPKHTSGAYREDATVMVASRGLGAPRLFNPPHVITVILQSGPEGIS